MGSGFSTCNAAASASIHNSIRSLNNPDRHSLKGAGLNPRSNSTNVAQRSVSKAFIDNSATLSDSCDSGISDDNRRHHNGLSKSVRKKSGIKNCDINHEKIVHDKPQCTSLDNTDAENCDLTMISENENDLTHQRISQARAQSQPQDTRYNRPISKPGSVRSNRQSAPNLLQLAIHEVDEEDEKMRVKTSRRMRPKSAHARRKRVTGQNDTESPSATSSRKTPKIKNSDGEGSEWSDDDFDSDVLSIPDETDLQERGQTLNTIKLGPQFDTLASDGVGGQGDWWTALSPLEDGPFSARSHGNFVHRVQDNGFAKKASERSISSVILLSPVEIPEYNPGTPNSCFSSYPITHSSTTTSTNISTTNISATTTMFPPSPYPTNPECSDRVQLNYTSPKLKRFRKHLESSEEHIFTEMVALSQKAYPLLVDYQMLVLTSRPRFLKVLSELRHLTGRETTVLESLDLVALQNIEIAFAEALYTIKDQVLPGAVSHFVVSHLSALERLFESKAEKNKEVTTSVPLLIEVEETGGRKNSKTGTDKEDSLDKPVEEGTDEALESQDGETQYKESAVNQVSRLRGAVQNNGTKAHREDREDEECKSHAHGQAVSVTGLPPSGTSLGLRPDSLSSTMSNPTRAHTSVRRRHTGQNRDIGTEQKDSKLTKTRPDSGIVVSSSASYSSSEATRETEVDVASSTEWIATSLEMLDQVYRVRTEDHDNIKDLVKAITKNCSSEQLKAHALYRWLTSQSLEYYKKVLAAKTNSPTSKLKQLADGKLTYAALYQEITRAAGLRCEKIDGFMKGADYKPGQPTRCPANRHSWNAVAFNGHFALVDAQCGSQPYKFFVEHYFMTPPDEFRLSHFPKDKKWLLMTQGIALDDFEGTLKTWPAMFAFNIRPLNMKSVIRTYDGRLSITVLLRSVAVTPMLEYQGPGPELDPDTLNFNIDQEIRNVDNAETFHMMLPQEGVYYFTLMVHDLEEDEDIPVFQYKIEYMDELL